MIAKGLLRGGATALALSIVAFGLAAPTALAQDEEAVFDGAIASTVRVISKSGLRTSTGWVIASADNANRAGAAVIVTTLGAIEGKAGIIVREPSSGTDHHATVLDIDYDRNLVLLEVKEITARQIPLSRTPPKVGRSVWAAGYNRSADRAEGERAARNATIKGGRLGREFLGKISSEARADTYQIEHDAAMVLGFEGGPLLDKCGRVIGVNMKSGGQVVPRAMMTINQADGIMNALRADEVIAFAKSKQVEPEISDGESCGSGAAGAAPKKAASAALAAPTPANGNAVGSGGGTSVGGLLASPALLGLLVLAGLGLAIFGFMALRRKPAGTGSPSIPGRVAPLAATPTDDSTMLLERSRTTAMRGASLRLDGHGPDGSPISLEFGSEALRGKPVLLGTGTNADARVADNRAEYKVSRLHARFSHDGVGFTVEDNKSLNGTMLNSKPLEPHQPTKIVTGDVISLADIDLRATIA